MRVQSSGCAVKLRMLVCCTSSKYRLRVLVCCTSSRYKLPVSGNGHVLLLDCVDYESGFGVDVGVPHIVLCWLLKHRRRISVLCVHHVVVTSCVCHRVLCDTKKDTPAQPEYVLRRAAGVPHAVQTRHGALHRPYISG